MAQTTDSFMPSYYGQMAFPYIGASEWSSGTDSMPFVTGYSGDTQPHNFLPDAMFSPQPGPTPVIIFFVYDIYLIMIVVFVWSLNFMDSKLINFCKAAFDKIY